MPVDTVCPIWGTPAVVQRDGDTILVEGARTAGAYHVFSGMVPELGKLSVTEKAILTRWLIEGRRGEKPLFSVEVTETMIGLAQSAPPLTVAAQLMGLLEYFINGTPELGKGVVCIFPEGSKALDRALAYSGCRTLGEVNFLLQYLRHKGWLAAGDGGVIVMVEGYNQFEAFRAAHPVPAFPLGEFAALA